MSGTQKNHRVLSDLPPLADEFLLGWLPKMAWFMFSSYTVCLYLTVYLLSSDLSKNMCIYYYFD